MEHQEYQERHALHAYQSGALRATVTFAAVLLSFAALHDITGGTESDLTNEYVTLVACGGWLLALSIALVRSSWRGLGAVSLVVLAGAAAAQGGIGPGIATWWAASVLSVALLWFAVVAFVLGASASRLGGQRAAEP